MPAERVSMRRVREILRSKYECAASARAVAVAVGTARSTVRLCLERLATAGLTWPLPSSLTDDALEALLFAPTGGSKPGARHKDEPDWTTIHRELRRPGVTLLLLWEEYRTVHPAGYGYSRWCELYRTWEGRLSPTMRQVHPAGERLFVDYAGQTVEVVDGDTGELHAAQVFVAVLGASNYTFAEATWIRHKVARAAELWLASGAISGLPLHEGDLIFQTSRSSQSAAIQNATGSIWRHTGPTPAPPSVANAGERWKSGLNGPVQRRRRSNAMTGRTNSARDVGSGMASTRLMEISPLPPLIADALTMARKSTPFNPPSMEPPPPP
jgi:hypothetical protein